MDHTPRQMQWRNIEKWRSFTMEKNSISGFHLNQHYKNLNNIKSEHGIIREKQVVSEAKRLSAVLANYGDTTIAHIQTAADYGIRTAEFPTTFEAYKNCRANNIAIMLGAPNFNVLGHIHEMYQRLQWLEKIFWSFCRLTTFQRLF